MDTGQAVHPAARPPSIPDTAGNGGRQALVQIAGYTARPPDAGLAAKEAALQQRVAELREQGVIGHRSRLRTPAAHIPNVREALPIPASVLRAAQLAMDPVKRHALMSGMRQKQMLTRADLSTLASLRAHPSRF